MGFFSAVKKWFGGGAADEETKNKKAGAPEEAPDAAPQAESPEGDAAREGAADSAPAPGAVPPAPADDAPAAQAGEPAEMPPAESGADAHPACAAEQGGEGPLDAPAAAVAEEEPAGPSSLTSEEAQADSGQAASTEPVAEPVAEAVLAQVEEPASSEQAVEPAAAEGRAEETPCATDEAQAATQAAREQAPEESREQATVREPDGAQQVSSAAPEAPEDVPPAETFGLDAQEAASLTLRLREAEPRLSAWLAIILDGVEEAGDALWQRLTFLLRALEAPPEETQAFVDDFRQWAERMDYRYVADFRSELQYRLALALDMEDEEDERSRLFLKISQGLARTREQFSRGLDALFSSHGELNEAFWEELEELFIMADLGYDASLELVQRLRERARKAGVTRAENVRELLMAELAEIFQTTRRITAVNPPEVVLFIGVNGVGKTTTIAKLAHRARMQGKKVMIAAADTFRAAAIEQLQVWAERVGALFHSRPAGSDPASVAYEAMDRALAEKVDILFVDTAGRLQTKTNLMEELTKIRQVLGKKHAGAPHRTVLVIDATTGQNALSQAKLFKEAAGVDELILTKLDGTAKGGVAIAVAMQEHLPITFVGLGEKLEDLRPFSGEDYARALLGQSTPVGSRTA